MRTKMLKFKAFGLLLMMVFSLISCSDDNDDPSTFLETNGGTVWTISQGGESIYAQINNSVSNPFEFWVSFGEDGCYEHVKITDEGSVEVIENTENKLQVRVNDDDDEYVILTLTITGKILTVKSEYFEDGQKVDEETIPLQETSVDTDDLLLCTF